MTVSFYKEGQSEGVLFRNQKSSPKAPDMTGTIKLTPDDIAALQRQAAAEGGGVLRIAGWTKKSKDGNSFLAINPEAEQRRKENQGFNQQAVEKQIMDDDLDDDIPF